MTIAQVKDEVKLPAMKRRRLTVTAKRNDSFEASVLRYATEQELPNVSVVLKAASGTRLAPRTVIRRCSVLSSRAFVRAKLNHSTK